MKKILILYLISLLISTVYSNIEFEIYHSIPGQKEQEVLAKRGKIEFSIEEVSKRLQSNHVIDGLAEIKQDHFSNNQIQQINSLCEKGGYYTIRIPNPKGKDYVQASLRACDIKKQITEKNQVQDRISLHFSEWANLLSVDYSLIPIDQVEKNYDEKKVSLQTFVSLHFPNSLTPLPPLHVQGEKKKKKEKTENSKKQNSNSENPQKEEEEEEEVEKPTGLFSGNLSSITMAIGVVLVFQTILNLVQPPATENPRNNNNNQHNNQRKKKN